MLNDIKNANNRELPANLANKQNLGFDPVRHKSDELKNRAASSSQAKEIVPEQIFQRLCEKDLIQLLNQFYTRSVFDSSRHGGRTGILSDVDGTMSHPEKRSALVDDFEEIAMAVREKGHELSFNTGRPSNEMDKFYKNSGVSESFLKGQRDFCEYGATFRSPETGGKEKIVEGLEHYKPIAKDIQDNIEKDIQAAIAEALQSDLQKILETFPKDTMKLLKELNEKYPGGLDRIEVSDETKKILKDITGGIPAAAVAARQSDLQKILEIIPEEAINKLEVSNKLKRLNEKYPGSLDTIKVSCKTMGLTMHCYKFWKSQIKPDMNDEEKESIKSIINELIYKPLTLIASNCLAKNPKYNAFRLADPEYTGIGIGLKETINITGGPPSKRTVTDKFLRDGAFTNAIYFGDDKPDLEMQAEGQSHIQFNSIDKEAIKQKFEFGKAVAEKAREKLEPTPVEVEKIGKQFQRLLKRLSLYSFFHLDGSTSEQKRLARLTNFISANQTKLRYQIFFAVKHDNTPQEVLNKADIVAEGQNQARDLFRNLVMDPKFLPWDGI